MPHKIVITGPPASGKSTTANKLAIMVQSGAAINVDDLRDMIKAGHAKPWEKNEEAKKQIILGAKNACALAKNFLKSGMDVFIDDVVLSEEIIATYKKNFGKGTKFFLLLPNKKTLLSRDNSREPSAIMGKRAEYLHEKFRTKKHSKDWCIIDNSNQTPEETALIIFSKL